MRFINQTLSDTGAQGPSLPARVLNPGCLRACIAVIMIAAAVYGQFPAGNMGSKVLGASVTARFRGQNITAANVPSHETIAIQSLSYAPVPYVLVTAGVGFNRFSVDAHNNTKFGGGFGFSPHLGVNLYTPYLLPGLLKITGGLSGLYLNSKDTQGYKYSGFILNPEVGALFTPGSYVETGLGLRVHMIEGTMYTPASTGGAYFSNDDILRFYANFMVKSKQEKVFMNFDFDIGPNVTSDWSSGPREASIGISIGMLLGWSERQAHSQKPPVYFDGYQEMKAKQDKMKESLQ